jgi:hypothetical protein
VEDRVDHLAAAGKVARPLRRRQQRLNQPPLRIRQIRFVSTFRATMLPTSGWDRIAHSKIA